MTTCSLKEALQGLWRRHRQVQERFRSREDEDRRRPFIHQEECVEYLKLDIISTCEVLKSLGQAVFDLNDGMNICNVSIILQLSF